MAGQVLQAQAAHLRLQSAVVAADVDVGAEGVLAGGGQQARVAVHGGGRLAEEADFVDAAEDEDAFFAGGGQRAGGGHRVAAGVQQRRVEVVLLKAVQQFGGALQAGEDLAVGAPQFGHALEGAVPLVAPLGVPER